MGRDELSDDDVTGNGTSERATGARDLPEPGAQVPSAALARAHGKSEGPPAGGDGHADSAASGGGGRQPAASARGFSATLALDDLQPLLAIIGGFGRDAELRVRSDEGGAGEVRYRAGKPVFGRFDGASGPRAIERALAVESGEVEVDFLQRSSSTEPRTPREVAAAFQRAFDVALAVRPPSPAPTPGEAAASGDGARGASRPPRAAARRYRWLVAPVLILALWAATAGYRWRGREGAPRDGGGVALESPRAGGAAAELQALRPSAPSAPEVSPPEVGPAPAARELHPGAHEPGPASLGAPVGLGEGPRRSPPASALGPPTPEPAPAAPAPPRSKAPMPRHDTRPAPTVDVETPAAPAASPPEPAPSQLPRVRILEDERPRTRVIE